MKPARRQRKIQKFNLDVDFYRAKGRKLKEKSKLRDVKRRSNLNRSGPIGALARRKEKKLATHNAEIKKIEIEPSLYEKGRKESIEAESRSKIEKQKWKGRTAVATALGGAYTGGKASEASEASSKASEAASGAAALKDVLENSNFSGEQPTVNSDTVSGLVTGVR